MDGAVLCGFKQRERINLIMLARLINRVCYRYGDHCLSRVTTDVVLLKGLAGEPYVQLQQKTKLLLNPKQTIVDLCEATTTRIEFFAENSRRFHPLTPVAFVLEQNFYIKYKDLYYFVMRNHPVADNSDSSTFFKTYGSLKLEGFVKKALNNLPTAGRISGRDFHNYLIRQVLEESEQWKFQRTSLLRILHIVQDQLAYYDKSWQPIQKKLQLKAYKRVKFIITLLLTQFAIVNYFVYFYLSWDIMQPFTVLFANFEVLLAYYFFVVNRKEYTYEKVSQNYFESKKVWWMKKEAFNFQRYNELLQLRQYIQRRYAMLNGEPFEVVRAMERPIQMLDTQ